MRLVPAIYPVLALLPRCYLFHGSEPSGSGDASVDPRPSSDAGVRPRMPGDPPTIPPDASVFVPEDVELPVERPSPELTCDSGDEVLVARCGALPILYVDPGGRAGAAGTASDPFRALADAWSACGDGCEIRLAAGELSLDGSPFSSERCVWISGGWTPGEVWSRSDGRTTLRGMGGEEGAFGTTGRMLIERVVIRDVASGIGAGMPSDLLVVRDVEIDASYSGVGTSGARGVRVCRTRIAAGYDGIDLSWGTEDVVIEDVEIDAGYAAISVSWESSSVLITGSSVHGGHIGVDVSWESHDVVIEDSSIDGDYAGLDVSWESNTVLVTGSTIGGCAQPVSVSQGAYSVKITGGSETRPCASGSYDG